MNQAFSLRLSHGSTLKWLMIILIGILVFGAVILPGIPQSIAAQTDITLTPTPGDLIGVISFTVDKYSFTINRVWEVTEAGDRTPSRAAFLILEMVLYNNDSEEACFYDRTFPATIQGETIKPDDMRQVRDEYYEGVDYPGSTFGQCLEKNSSAPSLLVYDIPADLPSITIEFNPEEKKSSFTLWLRRQATGEYIFGLEAVKKVVAVVSTFTPSPSPTITLTPSITPVVAVRYITEAQQVNIRACADPSCDILTTAFYGEAVQVIPPLSGDWYQVLLPTGQIGYVSASFTTDTVPAAASPTIATLQPTSTPGQTRYAMNTMNLRSCAGEGCDKVDTLEVGESFEVTGDAIDAAGQTWYSLDRSGSTVWAAGWLTSEERPVIQATSAPAAQPSGPDGVPPVPGAAASCIGNFDFSVCSQYQPAPSNCQEVRDRQIPERVAGCCFPARDRDKDGYACYDDQ